MLNNEWEVQLQQLRVELILMKESIKETSKDIIKENYSAYPIFIAHQEDIDLGEVILDKDDLATHWSISASTIEEFVERGLIQEDKQQLFKDSYKNPKEFICLFVIHKADARFVYIPYLAAATENQQ